MTIDLKNLIAPPNSNGPLKRHEKPAFDWMRYLFPALLSTLLTLIVLAPVAYVIKRTMPPSIVSVDLQSLLDEDQKRTHDIISKSRGTVIELQALMQKRTIDFTQQLSVAVEGLGKECNCIIVNQAALLGGTPIDMTNDVRQRMQ